ncbi:MAG: crotonobetainyl-CoA:carnitine CoA-transferase CaiB-like acyl-CoA transferase [Gammaproteobacteria bacterium]|jgi:crotonobetainyl-CoA:carnitine CoA-transferase CaiB-like acyl-CoA transferase
MAGLLDGIRVLDYGRFIAGPWCGALLADLGADVIRIEKVGGAEDRYINQVSSQDQTGVMYLQVNRNKRCLTLNPTKPEGQEVQRKLVESADMVIANMPPRALKGLALDYESLRAIKEDIILVSNTCFGTEGPYGAKLGFDGLAQSLSGNMHVSGDGDEPMRSYAPWVDFGTASLCAFGAMAALWSRQATGVGQEVQGSLLGTALTVTSSLLIEQQLTEANRVASGNRGQISAPADVFKTKDGHIMVLVIGPGMWERWAKLMGENSWLEDDRFKNDDLRGEHADIISERMQRWCDSRTNAQALAELEDGRVPAGPVYSPAQTLADPHVQQGGFLQPMDYPGLPGPAPLVTTPVKLLGTPGEIRRRAPLLGEHTDEILTEIGYGASDIEQLRAKRVV